jgi:hypothetical protein
MALVCLDALLALASLLLFAEDSAAAAPGGEPTASKPTASEPTASADKQVKLGGGGGSAGVSHMGTLPSLRVLDELERVMSSMQESLKLVLAWWAASSGGGGSSRGGGGGGRDSCRSSSTASTMHKGGSQFTGFTGTKARILTLQLVGK